MIRRLARTIILMTILLSGVATAQERQTEHTLRATPGVAGPPATIADMAWLAGTWRGDGLGGTSEEIWSEPQGGVMLGMYRHLKDGKPVFYELLTLSEVDGSLEIRLKHFHPDLRGWEERDASVAFPLVAKRDGMLFFGGMTFVPAGDRLTIYLAIGGRDGQVREETFRYTRQTPR